MQERSWLAVVDNFVGHCVAECIWTEANFLVAGVSDCWLSGRVALDGSRRAMDGCMAIGTLGTTRT